MNAVDTNVVVRFLIHDDAKQADAADRLFLTEDIWLAKTVLLETAWVLRSFYGFDREAIRHSFLGLLGRENIHAEAEAEVAAALALVESGVDLADALHLVSRPPGATFVSFDQALVRQAHRAGVARVTTPPI
jgi:predicted nucleic-acid-binding protein